MTLKEIQMVWLSGPLMACHVSRRFVESLGLVPDLLCFFRQLLDPRQNQLFKMTLRLTYSR